MLFDLDKRGEKSYASDVRNFLFSLEFGYSWLQQGPRCERAFISLFKQRLTDVIYTSRKALLCCKKISMPGSYFKSVLRSERYFEFVNIKCFTAYFREVTPRAVATEQLRI